MEASVTEKAAAAPVIDAGRTLPWLIYLVFFAVLNETVFNVSTPAISHQYGLSASGVSWVMTAFIVFFAMGSVDLRPALRPLQHQAADRDRHLPLRGGSAAGFLLQSALSGGDGRARRPGRRRLGAPGPHHGHDRALLPGGEAGRVFGTITSVVAFAAGVGPVIGGFVSGTLGWPFLFAIPLLTLVSIPFFLRLLPGGARRQGGVDILGARAGGPGHHGADLLSLVLRLVLPGRVCRGGHGPRRPDPPRDEPVHRSRPLPQRPIPGGHDLGFPRLQRFHRDHLRHPADVRRPHGPGTREIGLLMFPGAISGVVFGRLGGTMADRRGNGLVMGIGLTLLVGSLLAISFLVGLSPWLVSAGLLLTYIGFTLIQTGLINSVSQTLAMQQTGVGMGLFNLVTFISAAIGTALVARVLASGWFDHAVNPVITEAGAWPYSNLMLAFAVIIAAWAAWCTS